MRNQSKLGEILIQTGLIKPAQIDQVYKEQQHWGGRLAPLLIEMGLIGETHLVQFLHQELRLPIAALNGARQIPLEALRRVPVNLCERFDIIPIGYDGLHNRLQVGMLDPTEQNIMQELRSTTGHEIDPYVAELTAIRRSIRVYFYGESYSEASNIVPDLFPKMYPNHSHHLSLLIHKIVHCLLESKKA